MKIKIVANNPIDDQSSITELIGKEFETVPYREFDKETREEMKSLGEVAIRLDGTIREQYILNKNEYEVID